MKYIKKITEEVPYISVHGHDGGLAYVHAVLFETDAGYFRVLKVNTVTPELNEVQANAAYEYGKLVSMKKAVELFGQVIVEKFDHD